MLRLVGGGHVPLDRSGRLGFVNDTELLEAIATRCPASSPWAPLTPLLEAFERIGRAGWVTVLKVDGGREREVYTVVVSAGSLGQPSFRNDGGDLGALLREALRFFVEHSGAEA